MLNFEKPYPHITISTGTHEDGSRVPPVESNDAIREAMDNGTVKPARRDPQTLVRGYCLGDYDNGQAQ